MPPENSAATQYTEAVPTAGGDKPSGGKGRKPTPAKVLGGRNAHRLESKGKEGREVARVVAETAPAVTATAPAARQAGGGEATNGKQKGGGGNDSGQGGNVRPDTGSPAATTKVLVARKLPSGSSGLGEVLAEATGSSSSSGLGLLLPLAILAALAWALAFLWRQRQLAD